MAPLVGTALDTIYPADVAIRGDVHGLGEIARTEAQGGQDGLHGIHSGSRNINNGDSLVPTVEQTNSISGFNLLHGDDLHLDHYNNGSNNGGGIDEPSKNDSRAPLYPAGSSGRPTADNRDDSAGTGSVDIRDDRGGLQADVALAEHSATARLSAQNVAKLSTQHTRQPIENTATYAKSGFKRSRIKKGWLIKRLTGYSIAETEYGVSFLWVLSRKPDRTSADNSVWSLAGYFNWKSLEASGLLRKEKKTR